MKIKIAVGTTSELKLGAVARAFAKAGIDAEINGYKTESGVPKQPFSLEEIMTGAGNRARGAVAQDRNAGYGLGIESGIVEEDNGMYFELACCVLVDKDGHNPDMAFSAAVETQAKIVERIKADNSEAGEVVGKITGRPEKDPIFYYTGGRIKREEILEEVIFLTLARKFLNPGAYS